MLEDRLKQQIQINDKHKKAKGKKCINIKRNKTMLELLESKSKRTEITSK